MHTFTVHALMLTFTPAHPHAHTLPPIAACSVEALLKQFDDFEKSIDAKEDEVASMEEDAAAIELALRTGKIDMERVGADGAGIALRSASFNRLAMRGAGSGAARRSLQPPCSRRPGGRHRLGWCVRQPLRRPRSAASKAAARRQLAAAAASDPSAAATDGSRTAGTARLRRHPGPPQHWGGQWRR